MNDRESHAFTLKSGLQSIAAAVLLTSPSYAQGKKGPAARALAGGVKSEMKVILLLFTNTAVIFAQTMVKEEQVKNLVTDLAAKVSTGTTVNGHPLNANVSVTKGDVGLGNVNNTAQEPALGNPASDGYILSSTALGVRSWVAPSGGGAMIPMGYLDTDSSLGADSDAKIASQKAIRSYVDRALGSKAASNASTSVNGQPCALGGSCTVADTTKVPTTRQVNGHALSADVTVTKADVGLGNVVNMAQEAGLGNPASDGYVLSSTAAGVRSWVAPTGGGGVPYTGAVGDVDLGTHNITAGQFVSSDTTDTSLIVLKPGASSGFPSGMDVPSGDYGIYVNASNKPVLRSSAPADLIIPTAYTDVVAMFGGGTCSGFPKSDGTCVLVGTTSETLAAGNDSRLSDARTPTAHKTSHATGGGDAIVPADIGAAAANASTSVNGQTCALGSTCTVTADPTSAKFKTVKIGAYEVGAENASAAFADADLTNHAIVINDGNAKTITLASCYSDAGTSSITVKIGATTLFTMNCTNTPTTITSFNSAAVAANAQLDMSGTAGGTAKDIKLHIYGTVN